MPRSRSSFEKRCALMDLEPPGSVARRTEWGSRVQNMSDEDCVELYDAILGVAKLFSSDDIPLSLKELFRTTPMMRLLED